MERSLPVVTEAKTDSSTLDVFNELERLDKEIERNTNQYLGTLKDLEKQQMAVVTAAKKNAMAHVSPGVTREPPKLVSTAEGTVETVESVTVEPIVDMWKASRLVGGSTAPGADIIKTVAENFRTTAENQLHLLAIGSLKKKMEDLHKIAEEVKGFEKITTNAVKEREVKVEKRMTDFLQEIKTVANKRFGDRLDKKGEYEHAVNEFNKETNFTTKLSHFATIFTLLTQEAESMLQNRPPSDNDQEMKDLPGSGNPGKGKDEKKKTGAGDRAIALAYLGKDGNGATEDNKRKRTMGEEDADLDQLRTENQTLRETNEKLSEENVTVKKQIVELEQRNSEMTHKHEALQAENATLVTQNSTLTADLEKTNKELKQCGTKNEELERKLEESTKLVSERDAKILELENANRQLQLEKDALQSKYTKLENEKRSQQEENAEMERKIREPTNEKASLQHRVEAKRPPPPSEPARPPQGPNTGTEPRPVGNGQEQSVRKRIAKNSNDPPSAPANTGMGTGVTAVTPVPVPPPPTTNPEITAVTPVPGHAPTPTDPEMNEKRTTGTKRSSEDENDDIKNKAPRIPEDTSNNQVMDARPTSSLFTEEDPEASDTANERDSHSDG